MSRADGMFSSDHFFGFPPLKKGRGGGAGVDFGTNKSLHILQGSLL